VGLSIIGRLPFDASAYAPPTPLPEGWRAKRIIDERLGERWLCPDRPGLERDAVARGYAFSMDPGAVAGWEGPDAWVDVSATRARVSYDGWTDAVKRLQTRFRRTARGSGVRPSCRTWREPRGRIAECVGAFNFFDDSIGWQVERYEERPGDWFLDVDLMVLGESRPDEMTRLRAIFIDGPLGPAPTPKPRR